MSGSEIEALVRELESLGVEFRVVPRMDGSLRLSCWRTQASWPNRDRINHLIAERIDSSPEVSALVAELISNRATSNDRDGQS
jgi:hypothetical protein